MSSRGRRGLFAVSIVIGLVAGILPAGLSAAAPHSAPVSDAFASDVATLDASSRYSAFVHFSGGGPRQQVRFLKDRGLTPTVTFGAVDAVFATGTVGDFLELRTEPSVAYLEADRALEFLGDTATWATRARVANQAVSGGPFEDGEGDPITGEGIGIAIVDSGVAGSHPDLGPNLVANYKIVCSTPFLREGVDDPDQCFGPAVFPDVPDSDNTSGHGTHVAGIAAGTGAASKGTFKGVAPDASLYGYSTGEAISVLYAAAAFNHIVTNYDTFVPRIRVVNNSWGDPAGTDYNPNNILSKLTAAMVAKGASVIFAAGNGNATNYGGSGNEADDFLSSTAKDPTPGVISVANYSDANTGTREGTLSSSSSRGKKDVHESYPDISAPGSSIASTCLPNLPLCDLGPNLAWAPLYNLMSGTSMASPHIAGAAALLYQANPALSPAEVEDILQDTAYKFSFGAPYQSDPQNADGTHSFDKGAGLLDVPAALRAAGLGFAGVPAGGTTEVIIEDATNDEPVRAAADIVSVSATEITDGIRYGITVRDLGGTVGFFPSFRMFQKLNGRTLVTDLSVNATGGTPSAPNASTNNAIATDIVRDGNTVSFTLPWATLGNPSAGDPVHNVYLFSFGGPGIVTDMAPGGIALDSTVRPEHSAYTIRRDGVEGSHGGGTDPDPDPTPTDEPSPEPTPTPTPTDGPLTHGEETSSQEGFIEVGHPLSATDAEFGFVSCPEEPLSQGVDGYVFEIPAGEHKTFTVSGSEQPLWYDLDVFFYDAGCGYLDAVATASADEEGVLPAGAQYASVVLFDGVQTLATFKTYGEASDPDPDPTITPTPDPTPTDTTVSFTAGSATSGQYSDAVILEAELLDESGEPIAEREVAFSLSGNGESDTWTTTTDESGIASVEVRLNVAPGAYETTVTFPGEEDVYTGSGDSAEFEVRRDDSTATLSQTGRGANMELHASLVDSDTPISPLGDRELLFYADGELIGSSQTDANGTSSMQVPPKYRNGRAVFEVVFAGDDFYRGSSAKTSGEKI